MGFSSNLTAKSYTVNKGTFQNRIVYKHLNLNVQSTTCYNSTSTRDMYRDIIYHGVYCCPALAVVITHYKH